MSKRDAAAWVWDAVDVDHVLGKNVKGDRKMKCTWCGDEMTGGPARIRAHFVYDKDALRNYSQCSTPCLPFRVPSSDFLVLLVSRSFPPYRFEVERRTGIQKALRGRCI